MLTANTGQCTLPLQLNFTNARISCECANISTAADACICVQTCLSGRSSIRSSSKQQQYANVYICIGLCHYREAEHIVHTHCKESVVHTAQMNKNRKTTRAPPTLDACQHTLCAGVVRDTLWRATHSAALSLCECSAYKNWPLCVHATELLLTAAAASIVLRVPLSD
jgi:hypothetical protein